MIDFQGFRTVTERSARFDDKKPSVTYIFAPSLHLFMLFEMQVNHPALRGRQRIKNGLPAVARNRACEIISQGD